MLLELALTCATLRVVDGDTLRCDRERIRLTAIDAPEMPGHCRRGRVCASGDPFASKAALTRIMRQGKATIERLGRDRYGRVIADVRVNGLSVSCSLIRGGWAIHKPSWDNGGRVQAAMRRDCR